MQPETTTFRFSAEVDQIGAALAKAQGEFPTIKRTKTNPFYKTKYADLADIIEQTRPITSKNGLAVTQLPTTGGRITTLLLHSSGQWIMSEMDTLATKNDPQGQGSAITYARRYAYTAALGLSTDEDDDGNAAIAKAPQEAPTQPTAPIKAVTPRLDAKQIAELVDIAKKKGHETKADAVQFLNEVAVPGFATTNFLEADPAQFEQLKKAVISAGWSKPEPETVPDDLPF